MDMIINCLCLLGMIWAASAVINAFRGRRPHGQYGYNNHNGWGGALGGFGLGWLLGSSWQHNNDEATYQEQLDTQQAYMEDSYGSGYDGGESDWGNGGDWGGNHDGGGWGDWGGGDDGGGWGDSSD